LILGNSVSWEIWLIHTIKLFPENQIIQSQHRPVEVFFYKATILMVLEVGLTKTLISIKYPKSILRTDTCRMTQYSNSTKMTLIPRYLSVRSTLYSDPINRLIKSFC